jgi:methylthioribose-1-phosphate isomerase
VETAALRWEEGALLILDQRRLPDQEEWLRCTTVDQVAEAIRTMAVRGAPAIGLAAAYGMVLGASDPERSAELLAATRPTAANLRWALNRARDALRAPVATRSPHPRRAPVATEGDEEEPDPGEILLDHARRLHDEQLEAERRLGALGAERLEPGDRVLTHCNAGALATGGYGTAGGVLRTAWEQGRLGSVWVDETRPLLQGARLTAWELGRLGIPYRLVADASAGALMTRGLVDRVVVGADRIAANGDVANKVGTYPLAVLAARHGLPFLVAAPLSTIDPAAPDGSAIPIEERDPGEVLGSTAPPAAEALNLAFDVTPAELVTAIVTEAGVLEPPYEEAIARAVARRA